MLIKTSDALLCSRVPKNSFATANWNLSLVMEYARRVNITVCAVVGAKQL